MKPQPCFTEHLPVPGIRHELGAGKRAPTAARPPLPRCGRDRIHRFPHAPHWVSILLLAATIAAPVPCARADASLPRPTPEQVAFQNAELGLFIHFDIQVLDPEYQRAQAVSRPRSRSGSISPERFNPARLDTDQWLQTAQALGANYVVFTAKHSSGFLMWQSDLYPFGVRQSPWRDGKGDVVQDFLASCKKFDIRPGLYCSAGGNEYWNLHNGPIRYEGGRISGRQEDIADFIGMDLRMYTELFQKAGPLFEVWLDGGVDPFAGRLTPIIAKYEPGAVCFNGPADGVPAGLVRWSGNEDGFVEYPCWNTIDSTDDQTARGSGKPEGKYWLPVEADLPLRYPGIWMWKPGTEDKILCLSSLMARYLDTVGRGTNLIVNAVIDPEGRVPEADARRLAEFGAKIKEWFGRSIAQTSGRGNIIELKLPRPQEINFVSIMEDIREGQRVRQYVLDGLVDGQWRELATGESIGHKRIQQFGRIKVEAVRLQITQFVAEPIIRQLAVYSIQPLPSDPNAAIEPAPTSG